MKINFTSTMNFSGAHLMICFSIYFLLGTLVDGNNMSLTPDREASVIEGETLHLYCTYSGSSNPDFINWYLNGDPFGHVLDAADCSSVRGAHTDELNRYAFSCRGNIFTLSIYNISKTKDHDNKWECDVTIFDMEPPGRASTRIIVMESVPSGGSGSDLAVILSVMVAVISIMLILIACYCAYRRRRMTAKERDPVQQSMAEPVSVDLVDQNCQIQKMLPEQV